MPDIGVVALVSALFVAPSICSIGLEELEKWCIRQLRASNMEREQ